MEKHSASSMPAAAGAIREERKFLLRSDRLRAARILGNVERQNTRVVRAAALFHTVGQDRRSFFRRGSPALWGCIGAGGIALAWLLSVLI